MAVESKRQPQRRGGGGSRSGRGGAAAKENATTESEAGGEGSSAAQGGAALATLLTPSSPSTSAGRVPPSQRTLRKQSRASLQSPYPPRGSPRTPRRAGLLSSTSFTGSPQAPNSPRSPSMRALNAIVSLISPFSSARKSAAFGHPDETLNEDDEETRMDEDVEDDEEEDDVASQLYPSLPSEAKRIEYVAEDDSEQQESVEDGEAESSSKSQAEEEDEDGTEMLSGLDEDDDIAVTEDGYGVLDVTIVESEADQTRPVNGHANMTTPALMFGSTSAQQSVPVAVAPPSLPPARSPFRASAFPAPRFSTPSKMGFGAVAAAPVASAFDGPSVPVASTPFTFGSTGASQIGGLPTYPRPSATAKNTSPLSKNYDQLARFFAQKAAQEARAEATTSMRSMDEDEDGNEATGGGLTEIEMAGCMRLIEQSYAHGQGAEIDRLRQEALDGGRMYDDSRQQLLDDEEAAFARGHHINRSPSLPLGAAAGEASVAEQYAGFRSRPSSSFLAPNAYQRSDDARINRSLATAFQSAPAFAAPAARRHRPLYLGPGVGASATAAILRRNQQAQARRGALNSHRAAQQARLQDASRRAEEQRGVESPVKRRKLPGDQDDQPALFTTPTPHPLPAPPSAMQTQPQNTSARPAKRSAPEAAPSPPAARSATADAMLSILSSGPAIPSRAPAAPPTVSNPDVVNPYETASRITRRTTGASSVAAKEKERLRKEREERLKAMKEKEAREANETLRRAARAQSGGKKRGMRVEDEDEEDGDAEEKAQQERNKKAEEDRRRKNEELKRRTEKLMSKSKAATDAPESTAKQSATTTTSEQSVAAKPSEKKAEQIPALKPFSFNSAFAPKKPSPLSQAANSAGPDSPSGSSEASERTMKSSTSPGKFAFNTPASTAAPIVLDDDDDDDEPQIVAAVKSAPPLPAFSFGASAAANATAKPTLPLPASSSLGAPPASASNTSTSAQKPLIALTPTAAPTPSTAQSPAEQASKADVSSLPKFDFALDVVVANASTHIGLGDVVEKEAREAALSTSVSSLPKFDFAASGQAPSSAATGQVPSSVTTGQSPPSTTTSHDASADATDGNTTSALLSGTGEGEEDEESIHQVRCKVWSLSDGKWKDMGIGILRVKKNTQTSKQRVLVRSEGNGRVMVNFSVYASMKPTQDKTVVSFLGFDETGKPLSYRCKSKTEDSARQLKEALEASAAAMAAA